MAVEHRFLKACKREPLDRPPVWLMRQAGRYMPEYRELREGLTFLEFCKDPERCAQAAMLPIDMLSVDAAILFADILPILEGMGSRLAYEPGIGPVIANPIRRRRDVEQLREPVVATDSGYVLETVRRLRKQLEGRVPLIGFAGAPFTLASYMIEGKGSRNYQQVKQLMYREPATFDMLLDKLAAAVNEYLVAQVEAGAQAVQLFDSWAGVLAPAMYARFAARYARLALAGVQDRVPTILYVNGCGTLLDEMRSVGSDVLGIDWRIDLDAVRDEVGWDVALQGNLDPCVLYSQPEAIAEAVAQVIRAHGNKPGQIVNLGGGILPDIPFAHARAMVDAVVHHRWPE